MWGSAILDIGIGLILLYLLLALMCSVLQELLANVISWRGKHLRSSLQSMLNDPNMTGLVRRLYADPRIGGLALPGKLPSYIPTEAFAKAMVDIVRDLGTLDAGRFGAQGPLAPFLRDAGGDPDKLKVELETWFDSAMERFGGWYKRNVQIVLLLMGLTLAIGLNANTIEVARQLWLQPALRQAVVAQAVKLTETAPAPSTEANDGAAAGEAADANTGATRADAPEAVAAKPLPTMTTAQLTQELDKNLPIGWTATETARLFGSGADPGHPVDRQGLAFAWTTAIIGWLLTAIATSLGAQFWFDTLGKALQLRQTGTKPSEEKQR